MNGGRRRGLKALAGAAAWSAWGAGLGSLQACAPRGHTALPAHVTGGWLGEHMARGHAWRDGQWRAAATGTTKRVHTLIIGAGVAGLSAAHHLMQAGVDDIAVLDLDDAPGGNAQAHHMGGLACPLGAHYLPMPGPQAEEVQAWLASLGVIRHEHGRWLADERYTCHDPQERMFVPQAEASADGLWRQGHWQDGLFPPADDKASQARSHQDWQRLASLVARAQAELGFAMPTHRAPWTPGHTALDAQSFAHWLDAQGLHDPGLRWVMDYICRDDYGASAQRVSAWAGLHYFASRHGLHQPDEVNDPVLTWPEGNGWLTRQLAEPLKARWHAGQVVVAVHDGREAVNVRSVNARDGSPMNWQARHVVLAVPLRLALRLLDTPPAALSTVAPLLDMAPWLVSNLLLREPLDPRPGEALSWDNVLYTSQGVDGLPPSLGYVDARHQSLAQPTGASLITHYWALGGTQASQGQAWRKALHERPWQDWAWLVCRDLMRVHPDLPDKLLRIDLRRHGHAMVIPQPGLRGHPGLQALMKPQGLKGRLHFAHADLSAYSVFEEAFTHGARAARAIHGLS